MQVIFLTDSEIAALPVPIQSRIQSRITLPNPNKRTVKEGQAKNLETNELVRQYEANPEHNFGSPERNEEIAQAAKKNKERIKKSVATQNAARKEREKKESISKLSEFLIQDRIAAVENPSLPNLRKYLITAIKGTSLEDVNNALTLGAEINSKFNSGRHQNIQTPLQAAVVTRKCDEIIAVLLRKGADVSIENNDSKTVFDLAENKESYLKQLREHERLH